jgi:hypothetical protein
MTMSTFRRSPMKARTLLLKPLVAAALLCAGAAHAAPPANALNGAVPGMRGVPNNLNGLMQRGGVLSTNRSGQTVTRALRLDALGVDLSLGSALRQFNAGSAAALPGLPQNGMNAVSSTLSRNAVQGNDNRRGATRRISGGDDALPALKRPIREGRQATRDARRSGDDGNNNGFLGVGNSSTLGTDDGSDNDGGFLGAGDSSTLGTDNDRDAGDNGFLGIGDSSTLGTD